MTTRRVRLLSLVLLGLSACASSQQKLLAGRHYESALVGLPRGEVDGAALFNAIDADLQVGLHLQAIGADAVRAQLAAADTRAPPGLDQVVIVRVLHDSNQVPVTMLNVTLSLLYGRSLFPPIEPDNETLAALIGETSAPVTIRYPSVDALELLGRVTQNVLAGGPVGPVGMRGEAFSPASEILRSWLRPVNCLTPTDACRRYLLWPRPRVGGDAPLELAVSLRPGHSTAIIYRFALPPGSLEAGLGVLFGDRVRTVQDLHRRHGRGRSIVYPLDILEFTPGGRFTLASRRQFTRLVVGTRRRPGLRAHPGLRFIIDPVRFPGGEPAAAELRRLLLDLGLSHHQLEIRPPPAGWERARGLWVTHELTPLPPAGPHP